jgi:hypothetical protein
VFSVADRPWEEDPVIDMVDTVTSGFYVRDGVVGRLVSGTRRCVERGPDGRWDFDGNTDAPGQLNDYMMCRQYRRFMLAQAGTPMAGSLR